MKKDFVIPVVCGPTGSGKSDLVYNMYEEMPFEVVSADAFQVYRRLNIGTAKPSEELRGRIPHHQIDIVSIDGEYTTGSYVRDTEEILSGILQRGYMPVIVGGTGLYIDSLQKGIFEIPGKDLNYRNELENIALIKGKPYLYSMLEKIDPQYASKIHENDLARIIRALEVYHLTGFPISKAHLEFHSEPLFNYEVMVLSKERNELYERINGRTRVMLANGWLDEVSGILYDGYSPDMPSFRAIGYRELAEVASGDMDLESAAALIAQKTRNYAKRQFTWYRGMQGASFLDEAGIEDKIKVLYRRLYA